MKLNEWHYYCILSVIISYASMGSFGIVVSIIGITIGFLAAEIVNRHNNE